MNLDRIIAVRNDRTVYRDGDRCVKIFRPEYPKADVMNEARNHAIIEETGIRVPKLLEVTQIDGKWAIVTSYIRGKTLERLIEEESQKKEMYMNLLIDLQRDFHAKSGRRLNKLKEQIDEAITSSELNATTRYHLRASLEDMLRDDRICHGEFTPSKVILDEHEEPFLLDWSQAAQGNAAADAAQTYLLFWMRGGIGDAQKYLDLLCRRTAFSREDILKWMPIAAASKFTKCSKKEREFLLSWINVFDYT